MTIPKKAKEFKTQQSSVVILDKGDLPAGYVGEAYERETATESTFNGSHSLETCITRHGIIVGDDCSHYAITYDALKSLLAHAEKVLKRADA